MSTNAQKKDQQDTAGTILLVNAIDNTDAEIDESTFSKTWSWIEAPAGWTPVDGIPGGTSKIDGIIVFAEKYEEVAFRELCEAIHDNPAFKAVPLMIAVNQYQMPLANRVKELHYGDFLFTPIHEDELIQRLSRLSGE